MLMDAYRSSDTYEIALLFISGFRVIDTHRNGPRVTFVFENGDRCREVIKQYLCHELRIDAREYVDGIRTVKAMAYACK